ncbi:hypothetical protein K491DRAFT_151785 [Lophiostoma macrostomum CBS 122681]|uniref:Uncharacterized protein n=1 Tax=Lophiostoma macrostomum CBS 122681 TaxID=1314788 RepID=A0A6A6TI11_9PLEO|nr:hypothetical protein K491DRAFT_151785 [Lophiostoma macrostomum CBS 122681]
MFWGGCSEVIRQLRLLPDRKSRRVRRSVLEARKSHVHARCSLAPLRQPSAALPTATADWFLAGGRCFAGGRVCRGAGSAMKGSDWLPKGLAESSRGRRDVKDCGGSRLHAASENWQEASVAWCLRRCSFMKDARRGGQAKGLVERLFKIMIKLHADLPPGATGKRVSKPPNARWCRERAGLAQGKRAPSLRALRLF